MCMCVCLGSMLEVFIQKKSSLEPWGKDISIHLMRGVCRGICVCLCVSLSVRLTLTHWPLDCLAGRVSQSVPLASLAASCPPPPHLPSLWWWSNSWAKSSALMENRFQKPTHIRSHKHTHAHPIKLWVESVGFVRAVPERTRKWAYCWVSFPECQIATFWVVKASWVQPKRQKHSNQSIQPVWKKGGKFRYLCREEK